jgi:hypothetical protein
VTTREVWSTPHKEGDGIFPRFSHHRTLAPAPSQSAHPRLAHVSKPLIRLTLGDLQSFTQSLIQAGLAPIARARTLAAVKSLFGFCQRMRGVADAVT